MGFVSPNHGIRLTQSWDSSHPIMGFVSPNLMNMMEPTHPKQNTMGQLQKKINQGIGKDVPRSQRTPREIPI